MKQPRCVSFNNQQHSFLSNHSCQDVKDENTYVKALVVCLLSYC